jgi:CheY-like chemotaxis protein
MSSLSKPQFTKQVYQALRDLHDFAALQKLPLVDLLDKPYRTLEQNVRLLRTEILSAIEQLNPAGNLPSRAKERRPYMLLYGRYVQGMSTLELAEELGISVRQFRREHSRALSAIAELMWDRLSGQLNTKGDLTGSSTVIDRQEVIEAEAEQLISQARMEDLALCDLVSGIIATVTPLAAHRRIHVTSRVPDDLPFMRTSRTILRQAIMEVLTHALRQLDEGYIVLEGSFAQAVKLAITATGTFQVDEQKRASFEIGQKLIASLGGQIELSSSASHWQANMTLPAAQDKLIVVMDDNAGLVELYQRYLSGGHYRIIEAHSADEAIQSAKENELKLIILDVMMPEQDGWEILQRLRSVQETHNTPILICSVLNEPEIAYSLGASDYITKPITQSDLLTKVEYWTDAPLPRVG